MLRKTHGLLVFVLLVPLASHATDIRQRPYSFSFEVAVPKDDEQFVVCSNCPDNRLSTMPVAPKLAVRMSVKEKQTFPNVYGEYVGQTMKAETGQMLGCTESILFDFDSAELSRQERNRFTELMKELPATSTFDVAGYTCSIGTNTYNDNLSTRRANYIAGLLKANGKNVGTVEGKGKCCPVSDDKHLNRRVDITEQRKEEK
jgi:outer membrane protein OmpA-like peptidoglycan-associated protein